MSGTGTLVGVEKAIPTACSNHCGGKCMLKVHVRDGVITRIENDDEGEPQIRACLRCRAYRQRVYDPNRVQFPMKRVGERGEGKFERISWDEALDTIAKQYIRVRDTYGPASVFMVTGGGDATRLHRHDLFRGLFEMAGGYTTHWGTPSFEGALYAAMATYGTISESSEFEDLLNSRLIIMWGWNPAVTIHGCNTDWYLARARESGAKVITIDPRFTDSAATFADQWIPLIPGTDTAMLLAMAHVIISENLQDQKFLDKYTVGFDKFKDYVLGKEDGIAKTPTWAEKITGVPAKVIADLARQYATIKPAALVAGIGPGRAAYGEQYHHACQTLSAMTGNIGIHGGWSGRSEAPARFGGPEFKLSGFPQEKSLGNPVERGAPTTKYGLPTIKNVNLVTRIHLIKLAEAILKGKAGGYPADARMLFVMNTNYVNQSPNINRIVQALKSPRVEFIAVVEQVMNSTARFADILLPNTTFMERHDMTTAHGVIHYGYVQKLVEPLYESKSAVDICRALAVKLGFPDYITKSDEEIMKDLVKNSDIPDYATFRKTSIYRVPMPEAHVAFKKQVQGNVPFPTPSGKIEIYSSILAAMNNPEIPPVAKYMLAWEGRNDPLTKKYPLQLITSHFKRRAHTQFETMPWLREVQLQAVVINARDAAARGINDGDTVRVFNDRGQMLIPAIVTERIMPGVVDVSQGAWYNPDDKGIDRGGCANVLTRDEPSPGGALCINTGLVQVAKA